MSLRQTVIDLIQTHGDFSPVSDDRFNAIAHALFEHQFRGIESYRRFCEKRGRTPANFETYFDVPPVPTDVFKHLRLCTEPDTAHTFLTSGTTTDARGAHHFATLDLYRAAIDAPFEKFVNAAETDVVFVLAPDSTSLPESSLSWMLDQLVGARAQFFLSSVDGELEFDWVALQSALDRAAEQGRSVTLLGTAFAFVTFFDACDLSWNLAPGSRVMETGGLKGRTREVSREELYQSFEQRLGIESDHCVAEYSMTELSSQAYTNSLRDGVPWSDARFLVPPWARVDLLDPITMEPGDRGLIRWFDLANVDSVCSVLTSDIGERKADGFLLLGRATGSELRGCSLTIEEMTQ